MHPLSPAVSGNDAYNTNGSSASMVTVVRNDSHMRVHTAYTSCGYYSRAEFILFRASNCAATIEGSFYSITPHNIGIHNSMRSGHHLKWYIICKLFKNKASLLAIAIATDLV